MHPDCEVSLVDDEASDVEDASERVTAPVQLPYGVVPLPEKAQCGHSAPSSGSSLSMARDGHVLRERCRRRVGRQCLEGYVVLHHVDKFMQAGNQMDLKQENACIR